MDGIASRLAPLIKAGRSAAVVTIVDAQGSTPRDAGTRMIVTMDDIVGTIGGGRLEGEAICAARALIEDGRASARLSVPLGPRIGQCCGGYVLLDLERADPELLARIEGLEALHAAQAPVIGLFGAGHVGRALAAALRPLPFTLIWFDLLGGSVAQGLSPAPSPARLTVAPLDDLMALPAGAAAVVMTQDHPLDFRLAEAALSRGDLSYVGLIGSATKRARFEQLFCDHGGDPRVLAQLSCPVGGGTVRDKRPAVIAALVAAELVVALS